MSAFDLILNSQPSQFQDIYSLGKLSDHDVFAGTSKVTIPPINKPRRKVFQHQKDDYESMKKMHLDLKKRRYFNDHSDSQSKRT